MTKAEDGQRAAPAPPRHPRLKLAVAISLAALAGWVDAAGFIYFHGLFVSFMSGNSTQVAVALAHLDASGVWEFGRTILLFVLGVAGGEVIGAASGRWRLPVVLALEISCIATATAALHLRVGDVVVASLLTVAMGMQNAVLHRAGGVNVGLTYVTGTLVQAGRRLAGALRGVGHWRQPLLFGGLWLGLTGGGLGGAVIAAHSVAAALAAAAGLGRAILFCVLALEIAFAGTGGLDGSPAEA